MRRLKILRQCYKIARLVRIWQQISTLEQIHDFLTWKKALAKLCSKGFNAKV
jgi:hypothetical protein